ncbi:MAG: DUF1940 domain-containing protein [Thermoplasmata archaeon]
MEPSDEDITKAYCELLDMDIPADNPYFAYISEMRIAQASLGIAASDSKRVMVTRSLLDILDTLYENLFDSDSVIPDSLRKPLNHEQEVWLDLKEKMSQGDLRSANLLSSHAHMKLALRYLLMMRNDPLFKGKVSDYLIKYLGKLSIMTYREAMGHVLL